jgi:hypothetical protein
MGEELRLALLEIPLMLMTPIVRRTRKKTAAAKKIHFQKNY